MVVVKLIGGLGNQLFQYATGRSLANKLSTKLVLDLSAFEDYKLHKYSLQHFKILSESASDRLTARLKTLQNSSKMGRILSDIRNIGKREITSIRQYSEEGFEFQPDIFQQKDNVFLNGYWQSEKYFNDVRELLLDELQIITEQDIISKQISNDIKSTQSVSLHIRRGDYANNAETMKVHGICDLDYYKKALEKISKKVNEPHFFVFSDDHEWVRKNLILDFPCTYVEHNDASTNYEDLRLMSQCEHNIIANSSFSWWGAWLNQNKGKIVIAPQRWFASNDRSYIDVVPESWLKL